MIKTAIIVDDEEAGLENMERLLGLCDEIEVVAKTKIPEEAVNLITDKKPDIIFLDVEMPRMSGFEVLEITRNQGLNPIVIFTTGYNQYAIKAIKAQAFDYLLKPIVLDELKETLSRLSNNSIIGHRLNSSIASLLSPREIEILELVIQGKTSKEIAEELFISKTTVDTHRRNLLEKTGCRSTSELLMRVMG
ncbi:MAG: response regulator transcription factor [Bacteroidetes bacterium]|nr:response regulator transcription factor [Bacteroidota bacterium]